MTKTQSISALIKFTLIEIAQMSSPFRQQFFSSGCVARVIKTLYKEGTYYEIRYYRNGYNISVTHKDLRTAKQLFIEATYRKYAYQLAA